jgi:hypothetical protein
MGLDFLENTRTVLNAMGLGSLENWQKRSGPFVHL